MNLNITAYKMARPNENWYGDEAHDTLAEARVRLETLAQRPQVRMAAIFTETAWLQGLADRPRYIIDNTDRRNDPIGNVVGGFINSVSSTAI